MQHQHQEQQQQRVTSPEEGSLCEHAAARATRMAALAALGASNERDPLTGDELEPRRPMALLVSEEGQVAAFDLHVLYRLVLRRGKRAFKTLFHGRFMLQQQESEALMEDYIRYYGGA